MAAHVFVQVYIEETGKSGRAFRVPTKPDLEDLAKVVYREKKTALQHCDAVDLVFYNPGTEKSLQWRNRN